MLRKTITSVRSPLSDGAILPVLAEQKSISIIPFATTSIQRISGEFSTRQTLSADVFFSEMSSDKRTLFVSVCTFPTGGCHAFCDCLAHNWSQHPSVKIKMYPTFTQVTTTDTSCTYQNVVLTGCYFPKGYSTIQKLKRSYQFSESLSIYAVTPPHHEVTFGERSQELIQSFAGQTQYKIAAFTAGINVHLPHCIGLPCFQMPTNPLLTESEYSVPENCCGLLYIRGLFNPKTPVDTLLSEQGYVNVLPIQIYLYEYMLHVNQAAKLNKIVTPSVIVVAASSQEQELLSILETLKVKLIFVERLAFHAFSKALNTVGKKGGVIGTNGVQTLQEALSIGYKILIYANAPQNYKYYAYLAASVDPSLQQTAREMLGLTEKYSLLQDTSIVSAVIQSLQASIMSAQIEFEKKKIVNSSKKIINGSIDTMQVMQMLSQVTPAFSNTVVSIEQPENKPAEKNKKERIKKDSIRHFQPVLAEDNEESTMQSQRKNPRFNPY